MGKNKKSHSKKSDKETQSPLTKIFKDMIQKENTDPEKTKLLKETQDTRKRKHYSSSRSKSDHVIRSCESSSSERFNRNQYKPAEIVLEQKSVQHDCRSQSIPFQGNKKDSWWFWGAPNSGKQQSEDTCSRVTCALKRLASSEYTCIVCLIFLFLISVAVAFLMLFHTVSLSANTIMKKMPQTNSEEFRKKIEMLSNARDFSLGNELVKLKDNFDDSYRKDWDDSLQRQYGGLSDGNFHDSSFQESNNLEDSNNKMSNDLSSVLDNDKLNNGGNSENLRNFYKKLLQTDAQIKNLKLGMNYLSMVNPEPHNIKTNFDRIKRSAKDTKTLGFEKLPIFYPPYTGLKIDNNIKRSKRLFENTEEPTGFILEKKEIVVEYKKPLKRKENCSHTPKDTKSRESQIKHLFYKSNQRLDELLDKKLPEVIPDPGGINSLLTDKKLKHLEFDKIDRDTFKNKENGFKLEDNLIFNHGNEFNKDQSTKSDKDVTSNAATVMSNLGTENLAPSIYKEKTRKARKLMQAAEDESIEHEDRKEILADDTEAHDDIDKILDRQKRNNEQNNQDISNNQMKYDSNKVHNLNWKGPMPLYPDELNTIIEQAAIENIYKVEIPVDTKENVPEIDDFESGTNDVAYIEDYLDNKYGKLVRMAQAYSDYGVFNGKKVSGNEKDENVTERRVKSSVGKRNIVKRVFGRLLKGTRHEKPSTLKEISSKSTTFGFQPTTDARENVFRPKVITNTNQKHMEKTSDKIDIIYAQSTTLTYLPAAENEYIQSNNAINNEIELTDETFDKGSLSFLMSNTKKRYKNNHEYRKKISKVCDNTTSNDEEYNMSYIKRSLKSVVYDDGFFFKDNELAKGVNNSNKSLHETKLNENNKDVINKSGNELNKISVNIPEHNTGVDISEFFQIISKWFSTLASISMDDNETSSGLSSSIMKLTVNTSVPILDRNTIQQKSINTTDEVYPMYDLDVIDKIAHRSRVLMAIDELKKSKISTEVNIDHSGEKEASNNVSDIAEIRTENITTATLNNIDTFPSRVEKNTNTSIETDKDNKNISDSKTIVKRSLGDSGLIFWNDIYDDEYGLKIDPLDNKIGGKRSSKTNDFMKRSGMWIQDKVKKIADNYFRGPKEKKKEKKRNSRSINSFRTDPKEHSNFNLKRKARFLSNEDSDEISTNFADLTKKMKEVCKEAAKIIQDTKVMKVRRNNKEETMATSLMQQLVHLMTDLVNFQVQQITCLSLPPDLQNFLEWLTSPTSSGHYQSEEKSSSHENEYDVENMDLVTTESIEKEIHPESRSDCLGTLQSVQDLIQQYNDLSDEDKSKMTGVKEYLENQLDFLNRQLEFLGKYDFSTTYPYQERFRRHVTSQKQRKYLRNKLKRNLKNKFHKMIHYFGRNRTKITPNSKGASRVTENKKSTKNQKYIKHKIANKNEKVNNKITVAQNMKDDVDSFENIKKENDVLERNFHDLYYNVADTKKISTIKSFKNGVNI